MDYSRKKNKAGREGGWVGLRRTYFFESPLPLEGFLLCSWKFQTKQGFTLGKSTKLGYSRKKTAGFSK